MVPDNTATILINLKSSETHDPSRNESGTPDHSPRIVPPIINAIFRAITSAIGSSARHFTEVNTIAKAYRTAATIGSKLAIENADASGRSIKITPPNPRIIDADALILGLFLSNIAEIMIINIGAV